MEIGVCREEDSGCGRLGPSRIYEPMRGRRVKSVRDCQPDGKQLFLFPS